LSKSEDRLIDERCMDTIAPLGLEMTGIGTEQELALRQVTASRLSIREPSLGYFGLMGASVT